MKALLSKVHSIFENLIQQFPEIQAIDNFEQLDVEKQNAIKLFFQQEFIRTYKEQKKQDESITPSQFYRISSLALHPDRPKTQQHKTLGKVAFEQLTQIKNNFSLEFSEFSLVKNPANLYESNYKINLKLQAFNQKLIADLNNHSNGMRLLIKKMALITSTPFFFIKMLSTCNTSLVNLLLSYFIHYSGLFQLELYHKDYLEKALTQSISSQIDKIDFSQNKPEMSTLEDINFYISLNKKLITHCQKLNPDFVQKDEHNFFDLFDSFVNLHQIPGILPREQWNFAYVYEQTFNSLSILEYLQSNYHGQTFKELIINFAHSKQATLIKDFENYTMEEILNFIKIYDPKINQETLSSQKEHSVNITSSKLIFTEIVFDSSYAYRLKWEDFKQSFGSLSFFEKTKAVFELFALGIFAVINQIIFEVNRLLENTLDLAFNLISSLGLLILTAAVKIQQLFTVHPEENRIVIH